MEMNSNQDGWKMGDPYYCTQCDRNHIKGKIYKKHLKYAQDADPENGKDEEKDEQQTDEEELEEEAQDEDINENEEEEEDDGEDNDDDEEDEEEDDDGDGKDKMDPIERVKKLRGVGSATLRKLKKAGFTSLESIACTPPQLIQEDCGIGEKTTQKLIKRSMKKLNMGFKSAAEEWDRRKNIAQITTNAQELDDLLGGGIETGSLIEFFGEYRTGKTQIMHQLCVNVQLPKELGGLGGNALYIDTEGTFRPERIIQMAEAKDMDSEQVLQNIVFGRAYNSDHQILLIKESANLINEKNVKLIIIDSLIGHFRSEYVGRGTLANRQQSINQHLHALLRLCDIHTDLSIVFTNQVSAKPDVFYGNPLRATGGNIIAHASTIRVYLRKGKGQQRVAKIIDAPHLPEGEAIFSITEEGITD